MRSQNKALLGLLVLAFVISAGGLVFGTYLLLRPYSGDSGVAHELGGVFVFFGGACLVATFLASWLIAWANYG